MSRRLARIWLLPAVLMASEAWALGLGDIRLSSALNEPLRAEIDLLSATPEELANLHIELASADTFERYDLDKPADLGSLQFEVIGSGGLDGNLIRVTSQKPIREPFLSFLVEASWSRDRLLREYTLLLDPPTFAPTPATTSSQPVTAPSRSRQADSGTIERPAPQQAPEQQRAPPQQRAPSTPATSEPAASEPPLAETTAAPPPADMQFDATPVDDYRVQRGDTLWGIAQQVKQDSRLSTNQTMLAIFEANPEAFGGNINLLSAGARLSIPAADDMIRIDRSAANSEVERQHAAWSGSAATSRTQPSLVLVPPDGEQTDYQGGSAGTAGANAAAQDRIRELERAIAEQDSLLEIRDNELAALRDELARLRAADAEAPPVVDDVADEVTDDAAVEDDAVADDEAVAADADDELQVDDTAAEDDIVEPPVVDTQAPSQPVSTRPQEESLVDTVVGLLSGFWGILAGALVVVLGLLAWFVRRASRAGEDDTSGVWNALDEGDLAEGAMTATERLRPLERDDDTAIVVVEQDQAPDDVGEPSTADTLEAPVAADSGADFLAETGSSPTIEDTFSSETAINLDQSDPVAEADFHMAYGLYDQAADLINGALAVEPDRQDLLAKLCEIYFVWGNRDAFVDAASRMRGTVTGGDANPDWDKIVIMGQQIAGDHELFSGVSIGAATKAVDLSFEGGADEVGALDMDLAGDDDGTGGDFLDIGAGTGEVVALDDGSGDLDMVFEEPDTAESITQQIPESLDAASNEELEPTAASEAIDELQDTAETHAATDFDEVAAADATGLSPTIEQQFSSMDETGQMAALSASDATEIADLDEDRAEDATAEIELDDLGLDLDDLAATGLAGDVDSDEMLTDLEDTAESQILDLDSDTAATGRNLALDADSLAATGKNPELDSDFDAATGEMPAADEATGKNPMLQDEDTDVGLDHDLLDATGMTQVLSEDLAVATASDVDALLSDQDETMLAPQDDEDGEVTVALSGDAETLLAPLDDDDSTGLTDDAAFDFAKTEALPAEAYGDDSTTDEETGELVGLPGGTDLDLDLDDLTAALKVSEMGDTVSQPREDATVEQPRIRSGHNIDLDIGADNADDDGGPTQKIAAGELSDDLHDARTMTEVGTKLDLARAYVDMGDPGGARSILEEVLDEGDAGQRQQAQQLLDSLSG